MSTRTLTFSGADLRTKALAVDDDKLVVDAVTGEVTTGRRLHVSNGFTITQGSNIITELPKHDRPLVKYPEIKMTANSSGGYTASASSTYSSGNYPPYEAFNKIFPSGHDGGTEGWISGDTTYSDTATNGEYLPDGTDTFSGAPSGEQNGSWIKLQLPKKIKLNHLVLKQRYASSGQEYSANVVVYASVDNSSWQSLGTFDPSGSETFTFYTNSSYYYNYFVLHVKSVNHEFGYAAIEELEYWGYEEGDISVDVVHKSIPNKPGQQHLEVYWDANDTSSYSGSGSTTVTDLSGNGVTGNITGTNGFDTEYNAWVFDGDGDYIQKTNINSKAGNWIHSMTTWIYFNEFVTSKVFSVNPPSYLYGGHNETSAFFARSSGFIWDFGQSNNNTTTLTPQKNKWYHIALVHDGTGSKKMYIDNVLQTSFSYSNNTNIVMQTGATLNIGEGNLNGKVSNFRLFDKALSAEQVRELYEYDAPHFGHRQNLLALHKGNLGVGVAHPTSRFEVAGTETLQEYPPKAMTDHETYIEGHGVFRVSASSRFSGYEAFEAFDKNTTNDAYGWITDSDKYDSNGDYIGSQSLGGRSGEYIKIELPIKIKLSQIVVTSLDFGSRNPKQGCFLASTNGSEWIDVLTFSGLSTASTTRTWEVTTTDSYNHYALVIEKNNGDVGGISGVKEFRLFGTPAPSAIEDGHLTLGKALTLPRVSGHAAGAETPRAESLVVHYDTTVDSVVSGSTVVDISGQGANGTLNNSAAYSSSNRSLNQDATGDSIYISDIGNPSGAWVHSVSFWIYFLDLTSDRVFEATATGNTQDNIPHFVLESDGDVRWDFYASNIKTTSQPIAPGIWYHIALSYSGGVHGLTNSKIYINGVSSASEDNGSGNALNINANEAFYIGAGTKQRISNFKIWSGVALTAEEVAMEYALGRTGKSINLTDTALCLGGTVPRAQLDVRGSARFKRLNLVSNGDDASKNAPLRVYDYEGLKGWKIYSANQNGNLYFDGSDYTAGTACYMTDDGTASPLNFTGQHRTFIKDVPFTRAEELEGLIVSSDQNKYIKMSGGIEVGSNAITTNESLPVVSLSTIVNDKKCFGVISASEDPETRQEQYGNFVSINRKEVGDTRVYINSVGEGAMWVVNTAGPLESGDYITTSNVAGYGQKQDSEFLANYTVAKITMDCDFNPQDQPIQRIKRSNVIETHYTGMVPVIRGVPYEFVTTTVTADDAWSNVFITPSDITYAEWSNLEANVQNTYTLTYTQTSNVVYDVKYTKTTTTNVGADDAWDKVYIEPSTVTYTEWSNLEANVQNTYTLTYTQTSTEERTEVDDPSLWNIVYYQMVEQEVDADYPDAVKHETVTERLENALDEHGQLQWEDDPTETEKAYKIRYIDASGAQTDEANAVHTAAFVGCTYHCG
jgi:hypothetical protein